MSGNGSGAGDPTLEAATATATTFIDAVIWGEHHKVWELLGTKGRAEVLEVATKRGMDEALAERLGAGTGSDGETNEFLADLVNGLRSELAGNDLDHLSFTVDEAQSGGDRAAIVMHVPLHPNLGGTLPIGTLELGNDGTGWRIDRLIPLKSKG
ncbi:MAG: hypothetical protein ABR540_01915 [Acidimicrobiales bacterium]